MKYSRTMGLGVAVAIAGLTGCASMGGLTDGLRMLNPFGSKLMFIEPPATSELHPVNVIYLESENPVGPVFMAVQDEFNAASAGEAPYFQKVAMSSAAAQPEDKSLKIAKVVVSMQSGNVADSRSFERHFRCPGDKLVRTCNADQAIYYNTGCVVRTAQVSADLAISEMDTGRTLVSRRSAQTAESKICDDQPGETLAAEQDLLVSATQKVSNELLKGLLPRYNKRPSDLIEASTALAGDDAATFAAAAQAASNNDLVQARRIYQDLLARYPAQGELLFDVGLTEQALGNFATALDYYKQAMTTPTAPTDELNKYVPEVEGWINQGYSQVKKI